MLYRYVLYYREGSIKVWMNLEARAESPTLTEQSQILKALIDGLRGTDNMLEINGNNLTVAGVITLFLQKDGQEITSNFKLIFTWGNGPTIRDFMVNDAILGRGQICRLDTMGLLEKDTSHLKHHTCSINEMYMWLISQCLHLCNKDGVIYREVAYWMVSVGFMSPWKFQKKCTCTEKKHPTFYCGYILIRPCYIQWYFQTSAFCVAMATD